MQLLAKNGILSATLVMMPLDTSRITDHCYVTEIRVTALKLHVTRKQKLTKIVK